MRLINQQWCRQCLPHAESGLQRDCPGLMQVSGDMSRDTDHFFHYKNSNIWTITCVLQLAACFFESVRLVSRRASLACRATGHTCRRRCWPRVRTMIGGGSAIPPQSLPHARASHAVVRANQEGGGTALVARAAAAARPPTGSSSSSSRSRPRGTTWWT